MKILVGILHTIENEFQACLKAIHEQTQPPFDIFFISNRPNKEAHDELYKTFMDRAVEVDLFIKIDADMVLTRATFFAEIIEHFIQRPDLGHLTIAVHDWMTDRSVMGLHVFRSNHRWIIGRESYFVDTLDTTKDAEKDRENLAPAAIHCGDPSVFQAFHFGLHKAVKFAQITREAIDYSQRETHWRHFKSLDRHSQRNRDRRLALARAGFIHALANRFDSRHVDYSFAESHAAFSQYKELDSGQIDAKLRAFGPISWKFLPFRLRRHAANQMIV
jgi:hypothetical protein